MEKSRDLINEIIDYESGQMDDEMVVEFFQRIIDSGLVWNLQGSYGRMAKALIEERACTPR